MGSSLRGLLRRQHSSRPSNARSVLEAGVERGLHLGAQLHVSRGGEPVAELAIGESAPGVAMTVDTAMQWMCNTKPIMSVLAAKLCQEGQFDLDGSVSEYLPAFSGSGRDAVTLRNLLTHTVVFRNDPPLEAMMQPTWAEAVDLATSAALDNRFVPGRHAAYSTWYSWTLLGAVACEVTGRDLQLLTVTEVLKPAGMDGTSLADPSHQESPVAPIYNCSSDGPAIQAVFDRTLNPTIAYSPAISAAGPARDLGRLYDAFAGQSAVGNVGIDAKTAMEWSRTHRRGLVDQTYGVSTRWGLGFTTDPRRFGLADDAPCHGHLGMQSSISLYDKRYELALVILTNGVTEARTSRLREVGTIRAVYRDLCLAP
jgi:CubicO group peptidase (beta-lactamase class C family)